MEVYKMESNKRMIENQRTITDWAIKTFGYPTHGSVLIDRLVKEVEELRAIKYWDSDDELDRLIMECADIYIILVQITDCFGFDLHSCVDHKMMINRSRKWISFGNGTGQHIDNEEYEK